MPCMLFKAARKLIHDAPKAEPTIRCTRGYIGLSIGVKISYHFLSRSFYKYRQRWLRRPSFKTTWNDVSSNDFESKPKSDPRDALASHPVLDHTCYIAFRKTLYTFLFDKMQSSDMTRMPVHVLHKCYNCLTLIYNSRRTHMHIIMMLMRCLERIVQRNTEGVTP